MIEIQVHKKLQASQGDLYLEANCEVAKGEFVALYGASGAGKTSILRMLAGLMMPDSGQINVDGQCWYGSRINLRPQQRRIGLLFQDLALFPHMTVRQNVAFAQHKSKHADSIEEMLVALGILGIADRKPDTLSGGQKQRTALARALIQQPKILLLDEPLSALDEATRLDLQVLLSRLHREYDLTTIMVSHDVPEIIRMADKVIHLHEGKVAFCGTPSSFFGLGNFSGKFQFIGTVISVEKQGFLTVLHLTVGNDLIKVIADKSEGTYMPGDRVVIASKAFNPIIKKLNPL